MKNCPACQSDSLKKLTLIHQEGVRAEVNIGAGITSSGIGAGAGVGVSTSLLAAKCAPPKKDTDAFLTQSGKGLALVFFAPLLIAVMGNDSWGETSLLWKWWASVGFGLIVLLQLEFDKKQEKEHQQALADYEKTYMCTRCGHFFQPFA
jgi:hypothetical protein